MVCHFLTPLLKVLQVPVSCMQGSITTCFYHARHLSNGSVMCFAAQGNVPWGPRQRCTSIPPTSGSPAKRSRRHWQLACPSAHLQHTCSSRILALSREWASTPDADIKTTETCPGVCEADSAAWFCMKRGHRAQHALADAEEQPALSEADRQQELLYCASPVRWSLWPDASEVATHPPKMMTSWL